MATVNNVLLANFAPTNPVNVTSNLIWKLTRALKKAGWKYKASGNGTSKNTSSDPAADLWKGTTVQVNGGAAAFIDSAPTRGRMNIGNLLGITAADKGRFILLSGAAISANNNLHQIEEIVSATEVRIDARNFAVSGPDANTGSVGWQIFDPMDDQGGTGSNLGTNFSTGVASWWCAQGPSTLKIPFIAASTGTFVKGENIVQTTTGAEGELLGYVFESGVGFLVVAPRRRGTGTGVYGWDTGNVITGGTSGATLTQSGTTLEYRHEVVFWKAASDTTGGNIYHGTFEPVSQSAELFSVIAASAGCTATNAPGQGGTGNTFPTHGVAVWSSSTITTAILWFMGGSVGNAVIIAVDCIEEQTHSVDGSWIIAGANLGLAGGTHTGHMFQRLDNQEDGDLDPYVTFCPGTQEPLVTNQRTFGALAAGTTDSWSSSAVLTSSATVTYYKGWRRLGLSGEQSINLSAAVLYWRVVGTAYAATADTTPNKVVTISGFKKHKEPIWIGSHLIAHKILKGTLRWVFVTQGGNGTDLFSTVLLQLSGGVDPCIVGPWNGTPVYSN